MVDPRKPRSVRLNDEEIADVQRVADRDGLTWNEAARRMLAWASQMPEGWHPGKEGRQSDD